MEKCKYFLAVLGLFLIFTACKSTEELIVTTVEPAPVELAKSVKRIGITNAVRHFESSSFTGLVAKVISEEDQVLKEQGVHAAIQGLFEELAKDTRFDTILLLNTDAAIVFEKGGTLSEGSWKAIADLCRENQLDAIFSLAYYDTDTQVSLKKTKMEYRNLLRVKEEVKAHEITLETLIENGWRIYDPFSKEVLDEFSFTDQVVSTAKGLDPFRALEAIGGRRDSILHKSKFRGKTYGSRLQPYEKQVSRDYYSTGTSNFEKAHEKIVLERWDEAITLWRKELESEKPKFRAMACFNMAVLMEFRGELNSSLEWAETSYEHASLKNTSRYIEELKLRISKQELLRDQMVYTGHTR